MKKVILIIMVLVSSCLAQDSGSITINVDSLGNNYWAMYGKYLDKTTICPITKKYQHIVGIELKAINEYTGNFVLIPIDSLFLINEQDAFKLWQVGQWKRYKQDCYNDSLHESGFYVVSLLNDTLWISKPDTIVYHTQPTFEGFMDWLEKKMENK